MSATPNENRNRPADLLEGSAGAQLVEHWLGVFRKALYAETLPDTLDYKLRQPYYRDVRFLQQAITWPAADMTRLGWPDPGEEIYSGFLRETLRKIVTEGVHPSQMRRRGVYVLGTVQTEFRHNREKLWDCIKARPLDIAGALNSLKHPTEARAAAANPLLTVLAEAHAIVSARGGRPKKAIAPPKKLAPRQIQSELF